MSLPARSTRCSRCSPTDSGADRGVALMALGDFAEPDRCIDEGVRRTRCPSVYPRLAVSPESAGPHRMRGRHLGYRSRSGPRDGVGSIQLVGLRLDCAHGGLRTTPTSGVSPPATTSLQRLCTSVTRISEQNFQLTRATIGCGLLRSPSSARRGCPRAHLSGHCVRYGKGGPAHGDRPL